ncbi:MAG: ATP-dependent RNA helicase RhlE [Vicingaceae bacterium]|jgi:ATP-dependent RNA helicase RhlE
MTFLQLGISEHLKSVLEAENYNKVYPIQEKAIPSILKGRDILAIAPTGSGKTAAFALPILTNLKGKTITSNRHINVLVLVPTRELAIQVEQVFRLFGKSIPFPFKSFAVYGGASINPQMKSLQNVNVLVATPGRLIELAESNALHFSELSCLVLDEADKMLNLGFKKEMDHILSLLPTKRQNLLFSATLSPEVRKIEQLVLQNPEIIEIKSETDDLSLIQQVGYFVTADKKGPLLRHIIQDGNFSQVLIFTSSTYQADLVADKLRKNEIDAVAMHSKKSQGKRREALADFKAGKLRVLVATDLLSRGIDIEFLPHVINYELPRSPKDFIHRIGRTGRAENAGKAITFVTEEDKHHFRVIQKKMKRWVTMIDSENIDLT